MNEIQGSLAGIFFLGLYFDQNLEKYALLIWTLF